MNRVSGKVVVAESGAGIPDLLVSAYDMDGDMFPSAVADESPEVWKNSVKSRQQGIFQSPGARYDEDCR